MQRCILAVFLLLLPILGEAEELMNRVTIATSAIGTAEHPTIEGGWINDENKHTENALLSGCQTAKKTIPKAVHETAAQIPDTFSSDKNIKPLLAAAASQNKLAYVLQRANQLKLPATVAFIPMVESGYQTDAVSIKGAKGAWQLMANTAKEYGLDNEKSLQFTASTDAALHLLKHLHQQFHHWTLAFAAYNAGSGRVLAALHQHPRAQCLEDLELPWETKQYVYRLKQLQQTITLLHRAMIKMTA